MRKIKEIRIVKFQDMVYNGKWGFHSAYPFLRLSGRWLKDAGFEIYETCQIKVSKNKLVITKIKAPKTIIQTDIKKNNSKRIKHEAKNKDWA